MKFSRKHYTTPTIHVTSMYTENHLAAASGGGSNNGGRGGSGNLSKGIQFSEEEIPSSEYTLFE